MSDQRIEGKVVAIRGAVVDLAFEGALPPIEDAVEIFDSDGRILHQGRKPVARKT